MIFQYADSTLQTFYILIYDDEGLSVWDAVGKVWVDIFDEDNPSMGTDPWFYAIELQEHLTHVGWYVVEVDLSNTTEAGETVGIEGWLRYEIYKQQGISPENTDKRRAADSVFVVDGIEYAYEGLRADVINPIVSTNLSEVDRRRLARATARDRRGGAR